MRILIPALLLAACTITLAQEAPVPDPGPTKAVAYERLKLGEYWYGMYLPDGTTEGYSRLKFSETKGDGLHCDWELHISYDGGNYEEERKISFDKDWRLTYSEMQTGGRRILAAREGNVMVGKSGVDDLRVEVKEDAITGMGFILAACAPFNDGFNFSRPEYNEAQGLKEASETTFVVGDIEEVELPEGKVKARKITMQRGEKGPALPVWVNEAREIVQVDWGTKNYMKLHREKTDSLFKPAAPLLKQLEPDDKTKLVLTADFHGFKLAEMWELWATADGLKKWWPPEAEVEGKVGGKYVATWKNEAGEITWQLLGKVEIWEPNKKLGYTWRWDSTPEDAPDLHVVVEFSEVTDGVRLKIAHSAFDPDNDDQQNRASLHQGWEFFCNKLAALKK